MKQGERKPTTQPDEGHALRETRKKLGLKQAELARRAQISQIQVCRLEKGARNFTERTRENLWRALAVVEGERQHAPSVKGTLRNLADLKPQREKPLANISEGAIAGPEIGPFGLFDSVFAGLLPTPQDQVQKLQERIRELEMEIEKLHTEAFRAAYVHALDEKQLELCKDHATIEAAVKLLGRVEALEKDNADLKRLVGLKSESVHLESEIESRATGTKGD
jgi:transcriptional regulator with XRE-family HTH domain